MNTLKHISVVIPAYEEADAIAAAVSGTLSVFRASGVEAEVIVVDDGSTDSSAQAARTAGANVIMHPENVGYGAALKTGILHAKYPWIAIIDADGSYPVDEFRKLLDHVPSFDMVVGARTGQHYEGTRLKHLARSMFRWLSEFATGRDIPDINSGMRIFRRDFALSQWEHISTGFSFTTTLTVSMMLSGLFVKYVPISYNPRIGKSHVRYGRDTLRSAQIILQAILWYNPTKLFLLLGLAACGLSILAAAFILLLKAYAAEIMVIWAGASLGLVISAIGALTYICRHVTTALTQGKLYPQFGIPEPGTEVRGQKSEV